MVAIWNPLILGKFAYCFFLNEKSCIRDASMSRGKRNMSEIHEGQCGPHMSGFILAPKILRQGYYWLTMENDCFKLV